MHALKIDRSFVQDLGLKPAGEAMVHSLITLTMNIGMDVILEGVEKPEHLELIKKFGAHEVQGFLTGRQTQTRPAKLRVFSRASPKSHKRKPSFGSKATQSEKLTNGIVV